MPKDGFEDIAPEGESTCDYCGESEEYPLIGWIFMLDSGDSELGAALCSQECKELWLNQSPTGRAYKSKYMNECGEFTTLDNW